MSHETEQPQRIEDLDLTVSKRDEILQQVRIHEINNRYYGLLKDEMQVGEQLIAVIDFYWEFTQIDYEAKVIRALSLDLFDKAICKILDRRGAMSKEALGEILALNVVEDPVQKKYIDPAEKELLEDALTNLQEFEMIDTEDSSFIHLTKKGKYFLSKNKKCYTELHSFCLMFDLTTGRFDNVNWLNNFSSKERVESVVSEEFKCEEIIKAAAHIQRPDIYTPEELNDLTEAEIINQQSFKVKVKAALVADLCKATVRAVGYCPSTDVPDPYITRHLNTSANLNKLMADVPVVRINSEINPISEENWTRHVRYLRDSRQEIGSLKDLPKSVLKVQTAQLMSGQQIFEPEQFINHFAEIIPASSKEYFFNIMPESAGLVASVVAFIQYRLSESQKVYILLPEKERLTRKALKQVQKLMAIADHSPHVYVGITKKQRYDFMLKSDKAFFIPGSYSFDHELYNIPGFYIHRLTEQPCSFSLSFFFEQLVHSMILQSEEELVTKCQLLEINTEPVGKVMIEEEEIKYQKIKSLAGLFEGEKLNVYLRTYDKYLVSLRQSFALQIEAEVNELSVCLEETRLTLIQLEEVTSTLEKMEADLFSVQQSEYESLLFSDFRSALHNKRRSWIQRFIEGIEKKCLRDEVNKYSLKRLDKAMSSVNKYLEKHIFSEEEKKLLSRLKSNLTAAREVAKSSRVYLVDTNIFINDPNLVGNILQFHKVILSAKVIDELHSFTQSKRLKSEAQKALAVLMKLVNAGHPGLMMKDADVSVLPKDFKRSIADNLILSIGIKYKYMHPILLTEDHGLTLKAVSQKLETQTLAGFKASHKAMHDKVKHQQEQLKKSLRSSPEDHA